MDPIHVVTTRDGLELPVLDVSHPAFRVELSAEEQAVRVAQFIDEQRRFSRIPRPLGRALLFFFLRGSRLGRALRQARSGYLNAIDTYILKLGPDNLGSWARAADKRIAASLPALGMRLRVQDVAEQMADAVTPALRRDRERPLWFLNLAGGTAIDSLNALILLQRRAPQLLQRPIAIVILDLEPAGPAVAELALNVLQRPRAPLHDLAIELSHVHWNWANGHVLSAALDAAADANALTLVSSEGGLFEYGSDAEIVDALGRLRREHVVAVVGSVTRDDEAMQWLRAFGSAPTRPRGLEVFRALVAASGWHVVRASERPFSDHVTLLPS